MAETAGRNMLNWARSLFDGELAALSFDQASSLDISEIRKRSESFRRHLRRVKNGIKAPEFSWYPYESLMNFYPIEQMLQGGDRRLLAIAGEQTVLDLGCGDGDVAYFLENLGCHVHAVDLPSTNFNRMLGVRALKESLRSSVEIFEVDLDSRFNLPAQRWGLAFFCGILYHLKNPFYALERLASSAQHCILSTRVARHSADGRLNFHDYPVAYLLDAEEANNDPTNYWIFSEAGLRRLLHRTGWDVRGYTTTGETHKSNPSSQDADERAFCFLRSRHY